MTTTSLKAISPIDGRYQAQTAALADYFSEYALIRYRFLVEIRWLIALAERPEIPEVRPFTPAERALLESWIASFSEADAARIKQIEQTTQHDAKAVEDDLRERLRLSEDISNLACGPRPETGLARDQPPRAKIFHHLIRCNTIGLDVTRDVRFCVSLGHLRQAVQPAGPWVLCRVRRVPRPIGRGFTDRRLKPSVNRGRPG